MVQSLDDRTSSAADTRMLLSSQAAWSPSDVWRVSLPSRWRRCCTLAGALGAGAILSLLAAPLPSHPSLITIAAVIAIISGLFSLWSP